jgi:hypothetical protein
MSTAWQRLRLWKERGKVEELDGFLYKGTGQLLMAGISGI